MTVVYDHGGGGSSGSQGSSNSIDAVTLAADSNSMNRNPPVSPPSQANRHLFDNEEHSDVKFIVGYGRGSTWRFPGHTKVLAETNEVFRDLFRQHNLVHNRTIYIENVEKRGFEQLLRFLYGHKVEFPSLYTAIDTLRAAEVFDCAPLAAVCIIHIDSNLDETNALNVFRSLGSPNGTPMNGHGPSAPPSIVSALIGELRHNCLVIIDKEAKTILRSETMEELSREQLECVLRRKSLQVNKEYDVWLTLDRWLNRECKRTNVENTNAAKRRVLGPTKFVVKFSTMKKSEFINGPGKILCVNEKEEILNRMKLATKNSWRDQEVALPKPLSARTNDGVSGCARSDGNNNKRSKTRTGKEKLNCVMDCVCRTLICFFD